jgi:hypothetical protein
MKKLHVALAGVVGVGVLGAVGFVGIAGGGPRTAHEQRAEAPMAADEPAAFEPTTPRAEPSVVEGNRAAEPPPPRTFPSVAPEPEFATLPVDERARLVRELRGDGGVPAGWQSRLEAALNDRDPWVQMDAAEVATELGYTPAIRTLAKVDIRKDPYLVGPVTRGLGALGTQATAEERAAARDRLVQLLAEERAKLTDPAIVLASIQALADLGDPSAVPALVDAMNDDRLFLGARSAAASALLAIGDARARPALEAFAAMLRSVPSESLDEMQRAVRDETVAAIAAR